MWKSLFAKLFGPKKKSLKATTLQEMIDSYPLVEMDRYGQLSIPLEHPAPAAPVKTADMKLTKVYAAEIFLLAEMWALAAYSFSKSAYKDHPCLRFAKEEDVQEWIHLTQQKYKRLDQTANLDPLFKARADTLRNAKQAFFQYTDNLLRLGYLTHSQVSLIKAHAKAMITWRIQFMPGQRMPPLYRYAQDALQNYLESLMDVPPLSNKQRRSPTNVR